MNSSEYLKRLMIMILGSLVFIIFVMVVADPCFHYHGRLPFLSYRLVEERYINDGIGRHFDFDAIITGTSMSQNFKTSEFDALFDTNSVKMPFAGSGFKEILENADRTLKRNPECKTVFMPIDYYGIIREYDWNQYSNIPYYLYDENPINDFPYIFNKEIWQKCLFSNIKNTISGVPSMTMDDYSSWDHPTGMEAIYNNGFKRLEDVRDMRTELDSEDYSRVEDTINKLFRNILEKYPEVEFIFYYTPYSIVSFDTLYRDGRTLMQFQAEEMMSRALLEYKNVKLYEFFEYTDIICNPDYYRDPEHYSAKVSSMILEWISEDKNRITYDNLEDHMRFMRDYYLNYDYDGFFESH